MSWLLVWLAVAPVHAQELPDHRNEWRYGAFLDLSYPVDFNFPENHRWRGRTTTARFNELAPNMGLAYIRKAISAKSKWGMEFGVQGGYDSKEFAFGQHRPLVGGADTLRHFSRANVTYRASVGKGLTLTAGLFKSYIGYESLYARDNFNYSRSWIADNAPYMNFGVNASYPVRDDLTAGLYVINGYLHLAHPNDLPSYGARLTWKPTPRLTVTENLYYGPDQQNTALEFWRFFSDFIMEWKGEKTTVAFSYDIGTENMAERPGHPRTFWTGGALFWHWRVTGPWSLALRPEFYWDRNGRQTGFQQFVKAITTTLEYKKPVGMQIARFRLEHRYDESTGAQGGFFKGGDVAPGIPGLTPGQHLLFLSVIWSFDS